MPTKTYTAKYNIDAKNATVTIKNLNRQMGQYANILADVSRQQQALNNQATGVQDALRKLNAQLNLANLKLSQIALNTENSSGTLRNQQKQINSASGSWQNYLSKIGLIIAAYELFFAARKELRTALEDAKEFSLAVAEIQTISQESGKSVNTWSQELRNLSEAFGITRIEAAEAAYQALSNQVVKAAQVQGFLAEEARLAAITQSGLDEAVKATTGVLNAYGLSADHARTVNDLLFATIERGRIRLTDLAEKIGRVAVVSSELGVSITEQQGAIALLTRRGVSSAEAMTFLRATMLKLIKPTDRMKEIFDELGVSSGKAAVETFGFFGALDKIEEIAKRNGDVVTELGETYNRVRALIGSLAIAAEDTEKEIDLLTDSATRASRAFDIVRESMGKRLQIQTELMRGEFRALADDIQLSGLTMIEAFGGADVIVQNLTASMLGLSASFVGSRVALAASSITFAKFKEIVSGLVGGRIGLAGGAIGTLIGLLANAALEAHRFKKSLDTIGETSVAKAAIDVAEKLAKLRDEISKDIIPQQRRIDDQFTPILQRIAAFNAESIKTSKQAELNFEALADVIKDNVKDAIDEARESLRKLNAELSNLEGSTQKRGDQIGLLGFQDEIKGFQESLIGRSGRQQVEAISNFTQQLNRRGLEALEAGNEAVADRIFAQAEQIRNQARNTLKGVIEQKGPAQIRNVQDVLQLRRINRERVVAENLLEKLNSDQNDLVRERLRLLREIQAEEKKQAEELKAQQKAQEASFKSLQKTLDALDNATTSQGVAALLPQLRQDSSGAKLSNDSRLQIEQQYFQQLRNLRQAEDERAKQERLTALRRSLAEQQALEKKQIEDIENLKLRRAEQTEERRAAIRESLTPLVEVFRRAAETQPAASTTARTLRSTAGQLEAFIEAPKQSAKEFKILQEEIDKAITRLNAIDPTTKRFNFQVGAQGNVLFGGNNTEETLVGKVSLELATQRNLTEEIRKIEERRAKLTEQRLNNLREIRAIESGAPQDRLGPNLQSNSSTQTNNNQVTNNFNFGSTNISANSSGDMVDALFSEFERRVRLGLINVQGIS